MLRIQFLVTVQYMRPFLVFFGQGSLQAKCLLAMILYFCNSCRMFLCYEFKGRRALVCSDFCFAQAMLCKVEIGAETI